MEESRHMCLDAARLRLVFGLDRSLWGRQMGITVVGSEGGSGIGFYRSLLDGRLNAYL